jgi:hypothetical protein
MPTVISLADLMSRIQEYLRRRREARQPERAALLEPRQPR